MRASRFVQLLASSALVCALTLACGEKRPENTYRISVEALEDSPTRLVRHYHLETTSKRTVTLWNLEKSTETNYDKLTTALGGTRESADVAPDHLRDIKIGEADIELIAELQSTGGQPSVSFEMTVKGEMPSHSKRSIPLPAAGDLHQLVKETRPQGDADKGCALMQVHSGPRALVLGVG